MLSPAALQPKVLPSTHFPWLDSWWTSFTEEHLVRGGGGGPGGQGPGGHAACGMGSLHCPPEAFVGQYVTPGCAWQGLGGQLGAPAADAAS